ncbi:hypothetical protein PS004_23755, partial [Shigella sonnei]|nr:hypothetical protein [Shigella sonnei]
VMEEIIKPILAAISGRSLQSAEWKSLQEAVMEEIIKPILAAISGRSLQSAEWKARQHADEIEQKWVQETDGGSHRVP